MVLAQQENLTGWWIGFIVGIALVVVVVALLVLIIRAAGDIADVAENATAALVDARDRTEVLWQVATTNEVAGDILAGAQQARKALGG